MAFDPLEWIAFADTLGANTEAERRTAIGRLYYAVFLKSLLSLEHDALIEPRRDRSDHSRVARALKARRAAAGIAIENLGRLRESADYDTDRETTLPDLRRARALADEVIRMCASDWDRIA